MNCRPGDLAVVIRDLEAPGNVGRLVRVLYSGSDADPAEFWASPTPKNGHEWVVEPCGRLIGWGEGFKLVDDKGECLFPDADLKPLRNPGDDAQDETLQWKKVPDLFVARDHFVKPKEVQSVDLVFIWERKT